VPLQETLTALHAAREDGLTRHIGVSNFTVDWLKRAAEACPGKLANNQVEHHVYLDQSAVIETARDLDMSLTAYSPLAHGKTIGEDPVLAAVGDAHGKTAHQIALRWLVQRGVIAIPRSSNPDHARTNFEIFDFELTADDLARLSQLARPDGRVIDPDWAPVWDDAGSEHRI